MEVKKLIYLFIGAITLITSCSTDLSVIGDYKETMIIYGLLDQSQPKQYIKINKAFLGEGSALAYAQVKDSTQYAHSLNVTLNYKKNGTTLNSYTLTADNTISKLPGTFYGPDQQYAIYSIATPASMVNYTEGEFQLVVKNSETGTTASASTPLVSDALFTSPAAGVPYFSFILSGNNEYNYPLRWTTGKNAKIYQVTVRFNYIDSTTTGNVTKQLDWIFPEQKTVGLSGNEFLKGDFQGQSFLRFIGTQLDTYPGLIARKALPVDIILSAGADALSTYIEVNKPSTSIVQEKPEYTNITNGLGVFSARYNKTPLTKPLGGTTIDSLACGQYTKHLKFLNNLGTTCP